MQGVGAGVKVGFSLASLPTMVMWDRDSILLEKG